MRLFTAIELPDAVLESLSSWQPEVAALLPADQWRLTRPATWHLTLAFYGDVRGSVVDDLAERLCECAGQAAPPDLQLDDCGLFPGPFRARVFWTGVRDCSERPQLKRLARCCRRAGHATVRQQRSGAARFHLHITLARSRGEAQAELPVDASLLQPPPYRWSAERFALFQSILRPEGPQYRRLETFDFGG